MTPDPTCEGESRTIRYASHGTTAPWLARAVCADPTRFAGIGAPGCFLDIPFLLYHPQCHARPHPPHPTGLCRQADAPDRTSSAKQADGLGQINQAVAMMDGVTQQNAAPVEEASAAAAALREQAPHLTQLVGRFRLGG